MAILNTGRFAPATPLISDNESREQSYKDGRKNVYYYDCAYRKEDPMKIVKWLRRNFGERGVGWDFLLSRNMVVVEIWEEKYITMYEMWIT